MKGRPPIGSKASAHHGWQFHYVRLALAIGLALTALGVAVTLSRSPPIVVGSNEVRETSFVGYAHPGVQVCQAGEALPQDTSAIRLALDARLGPKVSVRVLAGTRTISSGIRGSGWSAGSVTIGVRPLQRAVANVSVCFTGGPQYEPLGVEGSQSSPSTAASTATGRLSGRTKIEYLHSGHSSWWSLASGVAERLGFGRGVSGTWITGLIIALMAVVLTGTSWLILTAVAPSGATGARTATATTRGGRTAITAGSLLRRVPRAAWACALLACLNAVCWSILTPPFQVPDEPDHVAYVQQLAETGELPSSSETAYSPSEQAALEALDQPIVRLRPEVPTISTQALQNRLALTLEEPRSGIGTGTAGTATSEPPAYYALETIPYELGPATNLLDRLALMRMLSALMAGIAALFVFLFVRETLPGAPWAWTVGSLAVAVAPMLGFMSGAVNPDAMLVAVTAVTFYCLARAFRRGLTQRLAIAIGCVVGLGLVTKLDFVALLPGITLGLVVVTVRAARVSRQRALRALASALTIAAIPGVAYLLIKTGATPAPESTNATAGSLGHEIGYVWQLYMPPLPGMSNYFPDILTTRQLWFNGLVGLYGWTDTMFPGWVYDLALIPAALIAALCVRTLLAERTTLARRAVELIVYAAMALGLMTLIGIGSYTDSLSHAPVWWQPRYMLAMFPLLALVLALAARGAGRRWGPTVGVLIVVLFLAHDLFSQLQVVARYYG